MLEQEVVTLHRPPPETFTLDNSLSDFSKMVTDRAGFCDLQAIAAKKPAAPPPIIATSLDMRLR
jgi:hypothetical protein